MGFMVEELYGISEHIWKHFSQIDGILPVVTIGSVINIRKQKLLMKRYHNGIRIKYLVGYGIVNAISNADLF